MISFLPSVNPNLIIMSENIQFSSTGFGSFLDCAVMNLLGAHTLVLKTICMLVHLFQSKCVWENIFQSLHFSKIISGLVLIPPGCRFFVCAILETTGGQIQVAVNSPGTEYTCFLSSPFSVWEAFEPRWVSQLPLIFPCKCGKHEPPLLSSAWTCTQWND